MKKDTIISEKQKPLWKRILAALLFTLAIALSMYIVLNTNWNNENIEIIGKQLNIAIYLTSLGVYFSYYKSIHINTKTSQFRDTFNIGPFKFGKWVIIQQYEYVSIFPQLLANGDTIFKVNLWYNKNKHWELYEEYSIKEAFVIAFELSETLNTELLDATKPNDYKWIDKEASKAKQSMIYRN